MHLYLGHMYQYACMYFIYSFIHTEHLYSGSLRKLLRGTPISSPARLKGTDLRREKMPMYVLGLFIFIKHVCMSSICIYYMYGTLQVRA